MRMVAALRLLLRQSWMGDRRQALSAFRLTVSCAQSELTSLRQQILRELKRRDLCAARIVSTPSRDESPASLDILLNCHAQRFKQCNELALHVSSLPAVRRVRWGRRAAWPH